MQAPPPANGVSSARLRLLVSVGSSSQSFGSCLKSICFWLLGIFYTASILLELQGSFKQPGQRHKSWERTRKFRPSGVQSLLCQLSGSPEDSDPSLPGSYIRNETLMCYRRRTSSTYRRGSVHALHTQESCLKSYTLVICAASCPFSLTQALGDLHPTPEHAKAAGPKPPGHISTKRRLGPQKFQSTELPRLGCY